MRKLVTMAAVSAALLVGSFATVQAYFLDPPHNESNGIYCYTCHTSAWQNYSPTGGLDDTSNNYLCGRCHDPDSQDPDLNHLGPGKKLHSSATTGSDKETWTTACTQCHDPHFQGQLDWEVEGIWLAWGNFDYFVSPLNFNEVDPMGGGYGATTVGMSAVAGVTPEWADTTKWNRKGGFSLPGRASDVSRGLILVTNKANPQLDGEAFEIIGVSGTGPTYTLKVKGNMTAAPNGGTFGVIYGQSLHAVIYPPGSTKASQARNVKFFRPDLTAGEGGFVDSSATAEPVGVCQVCHTQTNIWNSGEVMDDNPEHNPLAQPCNDCHNLVAGGAGGAEHPAFIGDSYPGSECVNCHSLIVANPDSAHAGGCDTCHTSTRPEIKTTVMATEIDSPLANILNADYLYAGGTAGVRLTYNSLGITDGGFKTIECGFCHVSKPAAIPLTHGNHDAATDFLPAAGETCDDCHSGATVQDIHGNDCGICHDATALAQTPPYYNIRREGDSADGIDGDARAYTSLTAAAGCAACHFTSTPAEVHHVSFNDLAVSGNCTGSCHLAGHEGDHSALVAGYANCTVNCHSGIIAGSGNIVQVDPVDPTVHYNCLTCHNNNGTLKTKVQADQSTPDLIVAMPASGGTCFDCHGEYVFNHRNIDHSGVVASETACVSCHTGTAGTTSTVPLNPTNAKVHDACATCHNSDGTLKTLLQADTHNPNWIVAMPDNLTAGLLDGGGVCSACHGAYFPSHATISHTTRVSGVAACTGCHTATADTGAGLPISAVDAKVHNACNTCHDDTPVTGTNKLWANPAVNTPLAPNMAAPGGNCTVCHGSYFDSHTHHTVNNEVTFSVTTDVTLGGSACYLCHDDANLGKGTLALGTWAAIYQEHQTINQTGGYNPCQVCHYYTTNRSGDADTPPVATVSSVIAASGPTTCTSCHTPKLGTHGSHLATEFGWDVTTKASCGGGGVAGVCHDWQNNQDVVLNVHGNILTYDDVLAPERPCNKCHQNVMLNQYARISGTDANAALATNRQAVCTVCHTATATLPFMHHENNSTYRTYIPATSCATKCHNGTLGHPGNHTALVADVAPCQSCHTATKGTINNVPVDGTPGNKVHDACTQCHVINPTTKMVELVAPSGSVTTMDNIDGTTATNNGGGPCSDCHTAYFDSHNHPHTLTSVVNPCEGCHVAGTAPFVGSSEVHYNGGNGCATCHDLDASPTGLLIVGSSAEGAIGTENCQGCHTGYFDSHSHGHTGISVAASCGTVDCHDGAGPNNNARYAATPPYLNNGEVHDTLTCGNCHNLTATGSGQPKAGTSAANWGLSWSATPSGTCEKCHNSGYFSSTHNGLTATELNTLHSTGGNAGAAVTTENAGCMVCHDGVGSSAAPTASNTTRPYIGAGGVHNTTGCATCHLTSGAMISPAPALAPLLSAAGGDCVGCHGAYFDSHTHHANPATNDFTLAPLLDLSYAAPGQTCGNASGSSCHHDYSDANAGQYPEMSDWITIQWEHDRATPKDGQGACITCHNGDNSVRTSSIVTGFASVRAVVRDKTAVHCLDCHTDKETPWVHGLRHVDHLKLNTTDQSTLHWIPIIEDTECTTCHAVVADYADDGGADGTESPGDIVIDIHRNACGLCHVSQPELKTVPNFAQFSQTNANGVYCVECHQAAIPLTYVFHDMLSTQSQVIARHDLLGNSGATPNGPADCLACHQEMYNAVPATMTTKKLDRHQTCEKCHTAADDIDGGSAITAIEAGSESAAFPANQTCEACHVNKAAYRLHGLTGDALPLDGVATEHNNLAGSGANDCSASGCHTMLNATEKMALHVKGCLTCHAPAALLITNPDLDGPVDALAQVDKGLPLSNDGYPAGTNLPVTCDNCHVQVGSFNMHGLDNITSASVHDKLAGSSTLSPGSAEDCETCHAAGTFQTRLALHKGGCAMCHGQATAPATTAISNGIAGTTINCETCHGDANPNAYYTMHAMTENAVATAGIHENISTLNSGFAGNDNCANCHAMGTQADMLRIHMSAPVKQNPAHTGNCLTCHTAGGKAATSITNGTSITAGGPGQGQTCFNCHELENDYSLHSLTVVGITSVHDKLALPSGTTSNCASGAGACHVITTVLDRITIHTNATTTCVDCHSWNDTMNTAIATGFNAIPANVGCEKCHDGAAGIPLANPANIAGDWYAHLDPDHTPTGYNVVLASTALSPTRQKCMVCHNEANIIDAGGQPLVGVHDIANNPDAKYSCKICHAANSALIGSALGKTGGGQCVTCHTGGFDSHLQRINSHADTSYNATLDKTTAGAPCGQCHNGLNADADGIPLNSWTDIRAEHTTISGTGSYNDCAMCHDYFDNGNRSGPAGTPVLSDVNDAIYLDATVICKNCHEPKYVTFHGGHDSTHWDWTTNSAKTCGAAGCHDYSAAGNPDVVGSVHNGPWAQIEYSGNICTNCHNQAPIGSGADGNTGAGTHNRGTAEITTNGGPANPDPAFHTEECIACHSGGNAFDSHLHDHSAELATDSVDSTLDDSLRTQDCDRCHTNTGGAAKAFIGGTTHTQGATGCASCHALPLSDALGPNGTRISVAANSPTGNFVAGGPADDCDACHGGGTAYFDNHLQRGVGSAGHITAENTATLALGGDRSQSSEDLCNACHDGNNADGNGIPLDSWADVLGEHDKTNPYDGVNSCDLCHISSRSNISHSGTIDPVFTVESVLGVIANGDGFLDIQCLDCHYDKKSPAGHGGHAATDWQWQAGAGSIDSCGTAVCHDSVGNPDVALDVHGNAGTITGRGATQFGGSCQVCHDNSGGGSGTAIGGILVNGYVGDARTTAQGGPANIGGPGNHTELCTTCHGSDIPRMHHERNMTSASPGRGIPQVTLEANGTQSNVQNGWCYLCHTDDNYSLNGGGGAFPNVTSQAELDLWQPGGPARTAVLKGSTNPNEQRPGVTPCAHCHFENTATEWRLKEYDLTKLLVARAGNADSPDPLTGTYTHMIPNRGIPINVVNTGVCLHCHGATNNRPVNYPYTGLRADGRAVKPGHGWRIEMIHGDETDPAELPRIRMALHPGMIKYRLMATKPNDLAFTKTGTDQTEMWNRNNAYNDKIYNTTAHKVTQNAYGHTPQNLGKTGGLINLTKFYQQWGIDKLDQTWHGEYFTKVATQTVPYTINTNDGPFEVPLNP